MGSGSSGLVRVRPLGEAASEAVTAAPQEVAEAMGRAARHDPVAVLVLDEAFPEPDEALLARLVDGPADVWHAGVALGLDGQPRMWDHVDPLSMFSARVDPTIEVTSWRVSLRATLVRTAVLDQLGGPDPWFETLTGSGLDAGLRWIAGGALVRHVPSLVPAGAGPDWVVSNSDSLRLVVKNRGRTWGGWALQRSVMAREVGVGEGPALVSELMRSDRTVPPHYRSPGPVVDPAGTDRTVSVILPTVDRYSYLEPLLHQLAAQTATPHEVIIVDQTPLDRRRRDLADIEPDLPVTVIEITEPGQSTARNAAIGMATGELILFLDDDLDIEEGVLAGHTERLSHGIDSVSGGVDDATAGPPPEGFRHRRASDVFPAGNTMVRRSALRRSGLFDPVFDSGSRADHDLGMRLHLSGALLLYDPDVEVYHHHAPVGGLRTHGARTVTRASSRRSLTERNLPSATELYLGRKYYTGAQRKDGRRIAMLATLSGEGRAWRRVLRAVVQLLLLPSTWKDLRDTDRVAAEMFAARQPTPTLKHSGGVTP